MPRYTGPIVDAHHHLWRRSPGSHPWLEASDAPPLPPVIGADDHRRVFRGFDIVGTVFVEALAADPLAEIQEAEAVRRQTEGRIATAIIGHVPLDAPDIERRLDACRAASPAFRGVRDIVAAPAGRRHFARAPDLLSRRAFRRGLAALAERGLIFELMIDPEQYDEALSLIADLPTDLAIAVEHAGNPRDRSGQGLARWRKAMRRFGARPNTIMKVSALQAVDPGWSPQSLSSTLETLRDAFGAGRLAFGSDHPVHDLACPGDVALDVFLDITADWPATEQIELFRGCAERFYDLQHVGPLESGDACSA